MTIRRRSVTVSKRSVRTEVCRKLRWVLAVAACAGMACKSAGSAGQPPAAEPGRASLECPAALLSSQPTFTYTVSCTGFTPAAQKVHAHGQVSFVSECDDKVTLSFSNPKTLFTSGAELIVLEHRGEQKTETVSGDAGCHQTCFGSTVCPPPDDIDSKTGSLDVHTSTPEPDPSKSQSP